MKQGYEAYTKAHNSSLARSQNDLEGIRTLQQFILDRLTRCVVLIDQNNKEELLNDTRRIIDALQIIRTRLQQNDCSNQFSALQQMYEYCTVSMIEFSSNFDTDHIDGVRTMIHTVMGSLDQAIASSGTETGETQSESAETDSSVRSHSYDV